MVEYGHGVGDVAGKVGGGAGGVGGGGGDLGATLGQLISDPVNTITALPPEMLIVGAIALIFLLIFLKRAL